MATKKAPSRTKSTKKKKAKAKLDRTRKLRKRALARGRVAKKAIKSPRAVKKAAPKAKKAAKKGKAPKVATSVVRRRDASGHINARYGAELLRMSGAKGKGANADVAFVRGSRTRDDLAEELAEEAVHEATTGEHEGQDLLGQVVPEERGGPFVISAAGAEFAAGTDASNPKGSKREPFPTT
jgi:hypothetical protein